MLAETLIGVVLTLSAIAVITVKKPVYSCLFFLLTLLSLASLYLIQSAEFIAALQVLVYAGAILVIFMFVIILFQDAHQNIELVRPNAPKGLIISACLAALSSFVFFGYKLQMIEFKKTAAQEGFGSVELLGKFLYSQGFFPFEAIVMLFLIALVGSLYIGKKVG